MQVVVQVLVQTHRLLCTLAMVVLAVGVTALPVQAMPVQQILAAEVPVVITTAEQGVMAVLELL
jgi:hypothetical protein